MLTNNLIPALQFVSHAVATKEARYMLNGVLFKVTDSKITLAGTDGHRLAVCDITGDHELPEGEYVFPLDFIKRLIQTFKPTRTQSDTPITLSYLDADCSVHFVTDSDQKIGQCIVGTFPEIDRVIPEAEPKEGSIGINCIYYEQAMKAAKFICNPKFGVKLTTRGESESVLFEIPSLLNIEKAKVVVMPMRL